MDDNNTYYVLQLTLLMALMLQVWLLMQGCHRSGKTGKRDEKYSLQGKIREFENFAEIRELSGNFMKMVKLFHKDTTICKVVESFDELFLFWKTTGGFLLWHTFIN